MSAPGPRKRLDSLLTKALACDARAGDSRGVAMLDQMLTMNVLHVGLAQSAKRTSAAAACGLAGCFWLERAL